MTRLSKEEPAVRRNLRANKGDGVGYEIFSKFNFWCSNCGFAADIIGLGDCNVYFCPRCGEEVADE